MLVCLAAKQSKTEINPQYNLLLTYIELTIARIMNCEGSIWTL